MEQNWKNFRVKVSDYLKGDDYHTASDYELILKTVCLEASKDGKHRLVERDGYYFVEEIPAPTAEELAAQELAQAKAERADAVSKIIVEVDGMKFGGDEESQTRMGRTIAAAVALGVDLTTEKRTWVLADNAIAEVTIAQLAEALRIAGDAQTALWTIPYKEEN